jgi:hypothetical protein
VPAMTVSFNSTFDLPVPTGPPLEIKQLTTWEEEVLR